MKKPRISMIAALSEKNRAIGFKNELLWRIPDDLKRFKTLTTGRTVIMGYKTYESIGKPLPNRTNIVISLDTEHPIAGCITVGTLEEAFIEAKKVEKEEVFVIGGGLTYKDALPYADRLYLTIIHKDKNGDAFFPDYSEFKKEISSETHAEFDPPYTYVILEKNI